MSGDAEEPAPRIGWLRAILTAAIIVVVGIALCVIVPDQILKRVHSLNRHNLVAIATAMFFVVLFAMAWSLRVLQRRKVL